jgi:hypothetical protein
MKSAKIAGLRHGRVLEREEGIEQKTLMARVSAEQQVEQLSSTELRVTRDVVEDGGERADLQR